MKTKKLSGVYEKRGGLTAGKARWIRRRGIGFVRPHWGSSGALAIGSVQRHDRGGMCDGATMSGERGELCRIARLSGISNFEASG